MATSTDGIGHAGELQHRYAEDGLIFLPHAFDEHDMRLIEAAYDWKLANPGPLAQWLYPEMGAKFLQAGGDSGREPCFQRMFAETPIVDVVAELFGSDDVWFIGEQLFLKEGGQQPARRTPWHQDSSYLPFEGRRIAVMWINLDSVSRDAALEVVRGSHRGPMFNGSMFDAKDDTEPLYVTGDLPRLPDIETDRTQWDIRGYAAERGDALIFHTGALHGGGGTPPGGRRRSLTLRFVGDDVVRVERPKVRSDSDIVNRDKLKAEKGDHVEDPNERYERLALGTPLHHCGILKVTPPGRR
jgi:ectoine hydroxylase-related dioxygenase (phytanoyl-CoA dioxygenase family)